MNKLAKYVDINTIEKAIVIASYAELKSSYRVAERFNVSATAVKRILKESGVIRTQSLAASERNRSELFKKAFESRSNNQSWKDSISRTRIERKIPGPKKGMGKIKGPRERPNNFADGEWAKLRNSCFNRDKYICLECGEKRGLTAHHKIPFWVRSEAFTDLSNLVTLCFKCHLKEGHLGNWRFFNPKYALNDQNLISKYSLDAERLNVLATLRKTK